jgi:microcystin-dependent protein
MKKDIKSVFSISVCILFVIAGFTSPVIADDDNDTDRDWHKLSLLQGTVSEFDNMQPYTTLNYIIALQGLFPSRPLSSLKIQGGVGVASADPYIGEIVLFAGNFAPRGWAFCDGQLMQISQNQALFSLLGTTYGGDGRTTFALPDLRGRVPVHEGTGPGLTDRRLGTSGGSETGQCDDTRPTPETTPETTSETTDITSTPETTAETTDITSTPETTSGTTDITSTPETLRDHRCHQHP